MDQGRRPGGRIHRSQDLKDALVAGREWEALRGSERQTFFIVRRGEYILASVEVQVSWTPAVHPLRKKCYTRQRGEDGVVSVVSTGPVGAGGPPTR